MNYRILITIDDDQQHCGADCPWFTFSDKALTQGFCLLFGYALAPSDFPELHHRTHACRLTTGVRHEGIECE